jgi:hypothetical protein
LRIAGPAVTEWRFVLCFRDETKNIASLPRLSCSLGFSGAAPAFGCAQIRQCGYCRAGNGEYFGDAFFLFLSPLIQFARELQPGRLIFVIPAFSVLVAGSPPVYKYGFTLENQVELLLE